MEFTGAQLLSIVDKINKGLEKEEVSEFCHEEIYFVTYKSVASQFYAKLEDYFDTARLCNSVYIHVKHLLTYLEDVVEADEKYTDLRSLLEDCDVPSLFIYSYAQKAWLAQDGPSFDFLDYVLNAGLKSSFSELVMNAIYEEFLEVQNAFVNALTDYLEEEVFVNE